MKKKCALCGKRVMVIQELEGLNLGPYVCNKCWTGKTGISAPKYIIDEFGEIEVLKFKAVTQEKAVKVCCSNSCKQGVHTIGDVVIFLDCSVKYHNGRIVEYGAFHVLPPKKYWCLFGNQKNLKEVR